MTVLPRLAALAFFLGSTVNLVLAGRRGIAWPYFESTNVNQVYNNGKVSCVYDYEKYPPPGGNRPAGMEFSVMQRTHDGSENQLAQAAAAAGSWVLGYNEPDNPNADGSNLSPQQAAQLWKQWFEPLRGQGKKLVAPAITSGVGSAKGLDWLDQFVAACNGCHFDAFTFHPYAADAASVKGSIDYVLNYKGGKYRPLWITEFGRDGANINRGSGVDFMNQMLPYLDNTPGIDRYSYIARIFKDSFEPNRDLQDTSGALTAMGQRYIN